MAACLLALSIAPALAACGGGSSDSSSSSTAETTAGSGHFTPHGHRDSGGGSAQFRVKGGDNSIQEFGAEASGAELEAAAKALHGFLDARAAGDWAAACRHVSQDIAESFTRLAEQGNSPQKTSCATALESLTNPAAKHELEKEAEEADVGSLRVEGDRAFVIYRGFEGTFTAIPMTREGGEWKVASLAGTPLS